MPLTVGPEQQDGALVDDDLHGALVVLDAWRIVLDGVARLGGIANLATVMPNGSPQVTPVWFDFDGKYIRIVGTH